MESKMKRSILLSAAMVIATSAFAKKKRKFDGLNCRPQFRKR
jgi:hypothetical protein